MESNVIRVFIAIELPDLIKAELFKLIENLKKPEFDFIKWIDSHGIHLTLKFLGNIQTGLLKDIKNVIAEACYSTRKFKLEIADLGVFPNIRRPRVVWIGIRGELTQLTTLQNSIESKLEILGFARENRPFSAHITLARVNEHHASAKLHDFSEMLQKYCYDKRFEITVDSISIMRSQLFKTGAVYNRLEQIQFALT